MPKISNGSTSNASPGQFAIECASVSLAEAQSKILNGDGLPSRSLAVLEKSQLDIVCADPRLTGFVNSNLSQLAKAKADIRIFTNVVKYLLTLLPKWELYRYGNEKRLGVLLS